MDVAEEFKSVFEAEFEHEFGWTASRVLEDLWFPSTDEVFTYLAPTSSCFRFSGSQDVEDLDLDELLGDDRESWFLDLQEKPTLVPTDLDMSLLRERLTVERSSLLVAALGVPSQDGASYPPRRGEVCEVIEYAIDAVDDEGYAFLLLPAWFLVADEGLHTRRRLLELGHIVDLVDFPMMRKPFDKATVGESFRACFLQWEGSKASEIPDTAFYSFRGSKVEDFTEFVMDFAVGNVWRWGFRTMLKADRPWSLTQLRPSSEGILEQVRAPEIERSEDPNAAAYLCITSIEINLFGLVRQRLIEMFGEVNLAWWIQGVPKGIRLKAAARQELEGLTDPKEFFLDLADLPQIINNQWQHFAPVLDRGNEGREAVIGRLQSVLPIRNRVMHAIRGQTNPLEQEELMFLTELGMQLNRAREGL